jgi:hypothetical protein
MLVEVKLRRSTQLLVVAVFSLLLGACGMRGKGGTGRGHSTH